MTVQPITAADRDVQHVATLQHLRGLNELLTGQVAQQGRLLSSASERAAHLEAQLAKVRAELDRSLETLDAQSGEARAWRAVDDARTRSRVLDWALTRSGISGCSYARDAFRLGPSRTATALGFLRHPLRRSALYRTHRGESAVDLDDSGATMVDAGDAEQPVVAGCDAMRGVITEPFGPASEVDMATFWAAAERLRPAAVAVCHPEWIGIRSSMQNLLSFSLLVDDAVTEHDALGLAERIAAAGIPAVVTGGFPRTYVHLLEALQRRGVRCYATWHGSFMQVGEPYNREARQELFGLARSGVIERIGFVKVGMAEAFQRRGYPTLTLFNYVREQPAPPSLGSADERPMIGIWSLGSVWRKLPYAMIAACAGIEPGPRVIAPGHDDAAMALASDLGVDLHMLGGAIEHAQMGRWLAQMDLNLYVTLSECAPMLPLESLAVGVPCLLGPNTHYFDDDEFLRSRLVVSAPDRHDCITRSIEAALDERTEIVEYYRDVFYPSHAAAARARVFDFVGADPDSVI